MSTKAAASSLATPNPYSALDDTSDSVPALTKNQKKRLKKAKKREEERATSAATSALPSSTPTTARKEPTPVKRSGGSTAISVSESSAKSAADEAAGLAALTQKDRANVYIYKGREIYWKPKGAKKAIRYVLTLEVPLLRPLSSYTDPNELARAAQAFAEPFLEDVQARLNAEGNVLIPGQEITAMFKKDSGYVLFHSGDGIDPAVQTYDEIVDKTATIKADSPEAIALTEVIDSGQPETFVEALEKPIFDTLKQDSASKADKAGNKHPPVNLVHSGQSCYINSTFLNLVRNPAVHKELRNPKNFVDGVRNPLYIAINGYLDRQASGKQDKYSLGELAARLGIDETQQDDVEFVWRKFSEQLNLSTMSPDSPLRSLFVDELTITPQAGASAQTLVSAAAAQTTGLHTNSTWKTGTHASSFSVYVGGRAGYTATALSALSETQKLAILADLIAHKDKVAEDLAALKETFGPEHKAKCDDLPTHYAELSRLVDIRKHPKQRELLDRLYHLGELARIETRFQAITKDSSPDEKKTLAIALLADDKVYWTDNISKILTLDQRKRVGEARRTTATKVTTPVEKPLSMTVESHGKKTEYELVSFSWHLGASGEGGHYITYERRGDEYWEINDLEKTSTKTDAATFAKKAETASFYVYVEQGLASSSTDSPAKPKVAGNTEIEKTGIDIGNTHLVAETGTLRNAGENVVLVNPTDSTLSRVDDQLGDASDPEAITTMKTNLSARKAQIVKDRAAFWKINKPSWRNKIDLSAGEGEVVTHSGKDGKSLQVLHVSMGDWSQFNASSDTGKAVIDEAVEKMVKGALEKAEKSGISEVAFPLVIIKDYPEARAYKVMRAAIEAFLEKRKNQYHSITKIKIVMNEDQKGKVFATVATTKPPASTTVAKPVTTPVATPVAPPEYQAGPQTTLVIDDTGLPTAFASATTDGTVFAANLKKEFEAVKDGEELTIDLCGVTTGASPDPKVKQFDIGHYGYVLATGNNIDFFKAAITDFQKALDAFARANSTKKVKIKLKVPNGLAPDLSHYAVVGSSPAATTTTTSAPPSFSPPTPAQAIKAAQTRFLNALTNVKPLPEIKVADTPIRLVTAAPNPSASSSPFTKPKGTDIQNEDTLISAIYAVQKNIDVDEVIIDCRPGCVAQPANGIVALDIRIFSEDRDERAQRLRNFMDQYVKMYGSTKPLKLILPDFLPALPSTPKPMFSVWERLPRVSARYSSFGQIPVVGTVTA